MDELTKGQAKALQAALNGNNVFVTGGGGVGKTYIVKKIITELEDKGKSVLVTASTGKAAALIGGVTVHSALNIPLSMCWEATPKIIPTNPLCETDVLVIDEISMIRLDVFEFIAKSVEIVNERRKRGPGPVQLIIAGDFAQLPPVIKHTTDGTPDEGDLMSKKYGFDIGSGYAFLAPAWQRCHFVICHLDEVVRQTDAEMIVAENALRFGDRSALAYFKNNARKDPFSEDDTPVYLCGKNRTADTINQQALEGISSDARSYHAIESGIVTNQDKQAPDKITLKVGAQVIMLQNSDHYRNGDSGVITAMTQDTVTVRIHGIEIVVPYATWDIYRYGVETEIDADGNNKKKVVRNKVGAFSQLPMRLGYAVTIHKAQGQTYDKLVLCLGDKHGKSEIFTYGQLYVALSRVREITGLYIDGDLDAVNKLADPVVADFYKQIEDYNEDHKAHTPDFDSEDVPALVSSKQQAQIVCESPIIAKIVYVFAQGICDDDSKVSMSNATVTVPSSDAEAVQKYCDAFQASNPAKFAK